MKRSTCSNRLRSLSCDSKLLEVRLHLIAQFWSSYESSISGEVESLLPHLVHFTSEHRAEGLALQDRLNQLGIELRDAVDGAWGKPPEITGDIRTNSWATRMQEKEKERMINPIERVEKPEMSVVGSSSRWLLGA